jgi:hypothetical protein
MRLRDLNIEAAGDQGPGQGRRHVLGARADGESMQNPGRSPGLRQNLIIVGGPEARIAMAEGLLEVVVQSTLDPCTNAAGAARA